MHFYFRSGEEVKPPVVIYSLNPPVKVSQFAKPFSVPRRVQRDKPTILIRRIFRRYPKSLPWLADLGTEVWRSVFSTYVYEWDSIQVVNKILNSGVFPIDPHATSTRFPPILQDKLAKFSSCLRARINLLRSLEF